MASGGKQLVFNSLERALSTDYNRLQAFSAADRAEMFRYLASVGYGLDDLQASSLDAQVLSSTSPAAADVLGGFTVLPAVGSLNLSVDPGVMMIVAPDSDTDSSVYKLVRDPIGVAPGGITMTSNASGSTRVDVVECSYSLATVESDSRDVFNPATGAFAASTITKAQQGVLTYRVRLGTPGSGFPGPASGWLPLAVAFVPNGTTTNDTVTFYDVRPLVCDRWDGMANLRTSTPRQGQPSTFMVDATTSGSVAACAGYVEATAADTFAANPQGLYRLGGQFGTSLIDLNLAQNRGGSVPANGTVYVYLAEPNGLPRWANYTPASSGARKPCNPRGVVLASGIAPNAVTGAPSSALTLSSLLGSNTTNKAVCIGATLTSGSNVQSLQTDGAVQTANGNAYAVVTGVNSGTATNFTLVAGTHYPPSAKSVLATIIAANSLAAGGTFTDAPGLGVNNLSGAEYTFQLLPSVTQANPTGGSISCVKSYMVTIPVPILSAASFIVHVGGIGGGLGLGVCFLQVTGWRL